MSDPKGQGQGLLVAAPERWDEACFSVPAVRALVAAGLPVTLLCPQEQEMFWQTLPGLAILHYPLKTAARAMAEVIGPSFEAAIVWENGLAAEACAKAQIARRTGPGDDRALVKRLTDPVGMAAPGPILHRVRHYLSLVEAMGLETGVPAYFEPAALGVEAIPGTVLLAPDSDFGRSHEWPLERWEALARELIARGKRLTLAGIAGAETLSMMLANALGGDIRAVTLDPLAASLPILAAHERVIAADGSLPHLASHAGATCVVLFGPNEPAWKRPLGKRHAILRQHVECSPCFSGKCAMDLRCQTELTVERVLAAVGA